MASSLDGVGQPLQLLAQRGLGARQQAGSGHLATALREPHFVGQLQVNKLVAERSTAARAALAGGMTRLSSQSSTRLAVAEATHEAILRTSLLTRRRSATRFVMSSSLVTLLSSRLQRDVKGQGC